MKVCQNCLNETSDDEEFCPCCGVKLDNAKKKGKCEKGQNVIQSASNKVVLIDEDTGKKPKQKEHISRVKWIPKKQRVGYAEMVERQKGYSVRLTGKHIDVSRYEIFPSNKNVYNAKRSGSIDAKDYEAEKLKWWEIYKWADRWLVKRKVGKVVSKQARVRPSGKSYWLLLLLSGLFGFVGLHNFYAGNTKRGIVSLSLFSWSILFVALIGRWAWLENFQYSLCAVPGFVCVMMWIWDFVAILFKRFEFKKSRLMFIYSLDVETRAKLGNKYIKVPNWYENNRG